MRNESETPSERYARERAEVKAKRDAEKAAAELADNLAAELAAKRQAIADEKQRQMQAELDAANAELAALKAKVEATTTTPPAAG